MRWMTQRSFSPAFSANGYTGTGKSGQRSLNRASKHFLLVAIMFQEGTEAEAFLELDRISFHGIYSFIIN